ncbi:pyridoxamine 5'-phosphate oxidase family protein [Methyloligella sp. 2.7D]|uniref:pyridoxamine 5'-phosphate oxidase family protein n=1 Tax=unclassified Methyloligella TaxID=2625955 RepID=UPI00157BD2BE|nr:pyridoxamine 5'-phosphate oxidase family protein [Methyloligella sp. GL2]QKP78559.1 pyridoxamine 5'-phosphate oxidase family protein [Methyloligella sp. GL2]
MENSLKQKALSILGDNRIMSVATIRPDGWPQNTTVGFGNSGLTLYFVCDRGSQKAANLAHDNRVSVTIDHDVTDMHSIEGLSMAAHAFVDESSMENAAALMAQKYPGVIDFPVPDPSQVHLVRLVPKVISVIDYSKGFGHADTVEIGPDDLS